MCQETGLLKLLFGCLIVILVISGCKKDDDKLIPFHLTPGASDIRLDTDTAGAAESYLPKIAISGSNIYTVWHDERNGN